MKKRIALILGLLLTITAVRVLSDGDIATFISDGDITYTQSFENIAERTVTIQVMQPNYVWNDITWKSGNATAIYYGNEVTADSGGQLSIKLSFVKSGLYPLYLGTNVWQTPVLRYIAFANKAGFVDAINALNAPEADIKTILKEEKENLALYLDIMSDISLGNAAKILENYIKKTPLDPAECILAVEVIKKCLLIEGINAKKIDDITPYRSLLGISGTALERHYKSDKSENITARLKKAVYASTQNFDKALVEAVVLNCILYAEGYGETKNAIIDYEVDIGVNTSSYPNSVYQSVTGRDYKNFTELKTALVSAATEPSRGISPGRTGGISTGIGVVSVSSALAEQIVNRNAGERERIFDDLSAVPWAKDAIEGLYYEGIVSGKTENKFYPLNTVTREEFVKMVIETFKLGSVLSPSVEFEDIDEEAWYYNYICIAKQCGIIKGITETTFGTGLAIKKQDIAVMVFNALNICGISLEKVREKTAFADEFDISEYAAEAVEELQTAGILSGDEDYRFNPGNLATRAEAAKILFGILTYLQ